MGIHSLSFLVGNSTFCSKYEQRNVKYWKTFNVNLINGKWWCTIYDKLFQLNNSIYVTSITLIRIKSLFIKLYPIVNINIVCLSQTFPPKLPPSTQRTFPTSPNAVAKCSIFLHQFVGNVILMPFYYTYLILIINTGPNLYSLCLCSSKRRFLYKRDEKIIN